MVLDLGRSLNLVLIAIITYWAAALLIWNTRRHALTKSDAIFLRFGFFIVVLLTAIIGPLATHYVYYDGK